MKRIAMFPACAVFFAMGCSTHYYVGNESPAVNRVEQVSVEEAVEKIFMKNATVTTIDGAERELTVTAVTSHGLYCQGPRRGPSVIIPVSSLKTIEVSPTGEVILWSGLVGFCGSALLAGIVRSEFGEEDATSRAVAVGGLGLVVGLIVGTAFEALQPSGSLFDFDYAGHPPEVPGRSMPTDTTLAPNREPSPGF